MTNHRPNRVRRLGRPEKGATFVPNWLIREGIREIGSNAFAVMCLLLSHIDGWGTSAVDMTQTLGWGKNRSRVAAALAELEKAGLLVIQEYVTERGHRIRQDYVVHADGSRFGDAERHEWSKRVVVASAGCTETVQGGSGA